jgi:hypothetical protein
MGPKEQNDGHRFNETGRFSPTRTKKLTVNGIALGTRVGTIGRIDLPRPEAETRTVKRVRDTPAFTRALGQACRQGDLNWETHKTLSV